jgi:hypothetical protein
VYQEGIHEDYFCKYIEGNIYFGEVWPGKFAYEQGEYVEKLITCIFEKDKIAIEVRNKQNGFTPAWQELTLKIHGASQETEVTVNGEITENIKDCTNYRNIIL